MSMPLSRCTILVTGATSGIGFETARQLAERGATVLLHGRTAATARAARDELVELADIDHRLLVPFEADFTRLAEVEEMARAILREYPSLDVVVNNAAIAPPEKHTLTQDGNEVTFQVNFLAHYLVTTLLQPALSSAPAARVVNVSSALHRGASIQWHDPNQRRRYARLAAYAQSQLALTIFAADPRVTAVSVHPGVCETNLRPIYGYHGMPPADGARHVVRLCDPATEVTNGDYYDQSDRVAPAVIAMKERSVGRLNKLAGLLVPHAA